MFLSVIHNHGHVGHSDNQLVHQISQDITECTICASHFKFSPDTNFTSHTHLSVEVIGQSISESPFINPAGKTQPGRAPPFRG